MRKIKLQMQVTLDGFAGCCDGGLGWMTAGWDAAMEKYVQKLNEGADTILIGRKTAEGMAVYWPTVRRNPNSLPRDRWMAEKIERTPKIIFSRTITSVDLVHSRVSHDIDAEITELKNRKGRDILLYGGAGIAAAFASRNLIDEYHLFVNPVAIGRGKAIFHEVGAQLELSLLRSMKTSVGILVNCYVPKRKNSFIHQTYQL